MKKVIWVMKKALATFAFICVLFVAAVFFVYMAAPFVNDNAARKTAKVLEHIPLPNDTELVETAYKAGKLVGNGNGMQYFGAILIRSELSLEELKGYYSKFADPEHQEWECEVEVQKGKDITIIEHGSLTFQTDVEGDNYYIVYSWGNNHSFFDEFDLRGH